eukprot:2515408-Karenia_brevis.AAC.1
MDGSCAAHISSRLEAMRRALNMLKAGLLRIPAFTQDFLEFLWTALVAPVFLYGLELVEMGTSTLQDLHKEEYQSWRGLLRMGGRCPVLAVQSYVRCTPLEIQVRSRRLAFFIHLVNAPIYSWQHAALLYHHTRNTSWYQAVVADLLKPTGRRQVSGLQLSRGSFQKTCMASGADCDHLAQGRMFGSLLCVSIAACWARA